MLQTAKLKTTVFSFLLVCSIHAHCGVLPPFSCGSAEMEKELVTMLNDDQGIRRSFSDKQLLASSQGKTIPEADRAELSQKMRQIDLLNREKLDEIVSKCGWPRNKIFYNTGLNAAFMIVQHGGREYQEKYESHIRESYARKEIPANVFALFEDRLLIGQGKPQRYGTQYTIGSDGLRKLLGAVEDPERLNERRLSIGLQVIPGYP